MPYFSLTSSNRYTKNSIIKTSVVQIFYFMTTGLALISFTIKHESSQRDHFFVFSTVFFTFLSQNFHQLHNAVMPYCDGLELSEQC